ncbi:MAG: antitoxin family protein [Acidobacteriota bacterium]|nr:antitoxin family protein [Acidobacteriota bacterium]
MEKILDATYDGEVFRPDEPVNLASNTKVKVIVEDEKAEPKKLELVEMPRKGKGEPYAFLNYLESLNLDGPSDFSRNLDEYLYGGKSLDDSE